jgi:hypothetical protein
MLSIIVAIICQLSIRIAPLHFSRQGGRLALRGARRGRGRSAGIGSRFAALPGGSRRAKRGRARGKRSVFHDGRGE